MSEADPASDAELARKAQAGEKHAFDRLVSRHKAALYRFARRYVGDDDEAYDIVQDSFISAWLALKRYDPQRPFPTWLRAIALNKCRDFGRRQAVRRYFLRFIVAHEAKVPTDNELEARIEQEALETERLQRLDKAIAGLRPFYKEPLLMTTTGGLTQEDAAAQLHTTTKAIEMRIRRAKKKLRKALPDFTREG